MPYLPLPNFSHDSGPRRIQSGPDHEGYVVLYSGVQSTGDDKGFVVAGSPLSGTLAQGVWGFDPNWRYVPSTLPGPTDSLDPTPYNVSGALDTYDATRIYTRDSVAGAQAASAIGPETGKINPRGGALQARSDVTRPETYMYYGGAAPDNQDYSPYNTPDANSAAEGKTGGGVTHRSFESSLLTNVLGSQGTSDRSQWRYHQPVYCKTYTETRRSETPGLMSTPLRYVYRGSASSYNYNYAGELLANKGGFEPLNYDDFGGGCDIPPPCPTTTGDPLNPKPGDTLRGSSFCTYDSITWYNTGSNEPIGTGDTYTIQESDYFHNIYYVVQYPNGSTASSDTSCLGIILPLGYGDFWIARIGDEWATQRYQSVNPSITIDDYGNSYIAWQLSETPGFSIDNKKVWLYIRKVNGRGEEIWTKRYNYNIAKFNNDSIKQPISILIDKTNTVLYVGIGVFRQYAVNTFATSVDLYKLDAVTGDLHWYYDHVLYPPGPTSGVIALNKFFFRLQWTSKAKSEIAILYRVDIWTTSVYKIRNVENPVSAFYPGIDPTSVTPGGTFTRSGSAPDSSTRIFDALIVSSTDGTNKNYLMSVDYVHRPILWEVDQNFVILPNTSGVLYGPTNSSVDEFCPKAIPAPVTFSGQEHYLTAHSEYNTNSAKLVLWNKDRIPVLSTNFYLGIPFALTVNPFNSSSVYVSTTIVNASGIPGLNVNMDTVFACVEYTPETNTINSYSTVAVIPNWKPSATTVSVQPPYFGAPDSINSNIDFVNKAVFTFIDGALANTVPKPILASGVNSLFAIGLSIKASGVSKTLEWNEDFPSIPENQGFIQGTNPITKNLGSASLPSVALYNNSSAGVAAPYSISSGTIDPPFNTPPADFTGIIQTSLGMDSL